MPFRYRRRPRGRFLFFPFAGAFLVFILGWVVMRLWNAILVPVLHVGELSYWKAVGLLILCRILFGNFRGGPGRRNRDGWRDKWAGMSAEDKQKFRQEWRDRCNAKKRQGGSENL